MSVKLYHSDCLSRLKLMEESSIDSIITDPPYGLSVHSTHEVAACLASWLDGKPFSAKKTGFMGKEWDGWVVGPEIWRECLRVLRPGGFMLMFSGTRSVDLATIALRLAGFEVKDQLCWLNSQGMPHGMDISKAIDKAAGAERKVVGTKVNTYDGAVRDPTKHGNPADQSNIGKWGLTKTPHGMPMTEPATEEAKQWQGWWSSLKPCVEPIVLAQKPLDGSIVQNILQYGVGALNIDATRIPVDLTVDDPRLGGQGSWSTDKAAKTVYQGGYSGERVGSSPLGRYPSGVLWDGSDEVREVFDSFGEKASGVPGKRRKPHQTHSMSGTLDMLDRQEVGYADKGGVHRFFKACEYSDEERRIYYCAKVSPKERNGSKHVSIKPLALMRYLCRLITPKGGVVLDPFAGTGTTGEAAVYEGFSAILIERDDQYDIDCQRRLALYLE
jgi:DNA modification methylase